MKNKIFLFFTLGVLTFSVGCKDWLDVNEDPNNLSELTSPKVSIPVAQVGIGNTLMGWDMGFAGGFWSQYWTQSYTASQFKFLDEYQEASFSTAYSNFYSKSLIDLQAIKNASEVGEGDYLIAEALSIFVWQVITDLWGDVPYTDALKGSDGVVAPEFTSGQDIYNDLLLRINTLLDADFSEAVIDERYDFIYDGHVDYWLEFANSLKLKLMLRLSETSSYNNAEVLNFINSGVDFLSHDALIPGGIWDSKDGKQHPMVEFEEGGAGYLSTNVIASKTMVDYLLVNGDPRIDAFYVSHGSHLGAFQGDFDSKEDSNGDGTPDDKEDYSTVEFDATSDIVLMSLSEVYFYIAEVYARAGDNANAQAYYEAGVDENLSYWGVSGNVTGTGGYAEWQNGTIEENIKQIAMQKWVAYCKLQHIEAFIERNRTKYPSVNPIDIASNRQLSFINFPVGDFTISVKGRGKLNGELPASPIYPNAVMNRNPNSAPQKPNVGVKVWWNQKSGS